MNEAIELRMRMLEALRVSFLALPWHLQVLQRCNYETNVVALFVSIDRLQAAELPTAAGE